MSDEEETPGSEKEGTEEGSEQEVPATTETADVTKPDNPAIEMKVVIILKANKVLLGVQSPDCDPVYKTMEGDLSSVLQVVPTLVAEAKLKWTASPRYPKADLPKLVVPAVTTPAVSKSGTKAAPAQPKFF